MFDEKRYMNRYRNEHKNEIRENAKKYYIRNREKILGQSKQYYIENKNERIKYLKQYYKNNYEKVKELNKQWAKNHREKIREIQKRWQSKKLTTDLKFNLNRRISCAIWQSLKGNKNGRKWEVLVGYNLNDLVKKLKKTMPEGYTWQDYLEGKLHVDHIIPKNAFNFSKPEHVDFKRCWSLENLRLLPVMENLKKYNKLEKPFQLALKI